MECFARFKINGLKVIQEFFDDEAVVVSLDTGVNSSLDQTGAAIWERLVD